MNLADAQSNFELRRESLACGDYEIDPPEVTDEHLAKAVDDFALKQPADVLDFLDNSAWFKEHVLEIVARCPEFRKALIQSDDIQIAAKKLANAEAQAAREQADNDAAFDDEPCHENFQGDF